jgi:hypothetical protein
MGYHYAIFTLRPVPISSRFILVDPSDSAVVELSARRRPDKDYRL